jgi:hypothetical protein
MASGLDLTAFDAALKQHYTDDRVEDMVYKDNPFLAMVPKYERFGGRNLPIPIIYGNPQGRSKTFANAQTRSEVTSSLVHDFVLTRVKDYGIATLDNETMLASEGDANAWMEAATLEIDGIINALTRSLAVNLTRTSAASIGQVNAEPSVNASTFDVVMKDAEEITNVEVDQMHVIHSALSGGSQRTSDGADNEWVVAAVNRSSGTITYTGSYDASGDIAADDYIFVEGDRGNGVSGLEDWIPATAPTSGDSHFGVDRSVDATRLAGLTYDGSSDPIEEALIKGDSLVAREGMKLTHYFMNHRALADLKKSLGSKVQYVNLQVNPRISFPGVVVDGSKGPISVIGDHNFPDNRIFGLNMDYIKFYSIGKAVRVLDTDGLQMLRQSSDDGVEVRYGFYGNLGVRAPGSCVNIQI